MANSRKNNYFLVFELLEHLPYLNDHYYECTAYDEVMVLFTVKPV